MMLKTRSLALDKLYNITVPALLSIFIGDPKYTVSDVAYLKSSKSTFTKKARTTILDKEVTFVMAMKYSDEYKEAGWRVVSVTVGTRRYYVYWYVAGLVFSPQSELLIARELRDRVDLAICSYVSANVNPKKVSVTHRSHS